MTIAPAPVAVLLYHRVAAPESDVHDLCVHPDRFAAQMERLRVHESVVPLAEARRPGRRPRVVITFDDGYADNAGVAREILEGRGLPATYFISVGLVGTDEELWWDRLERLLLRCAPRRRHLEVELGGHQLALDVGSKPARERAHRALYSRLRRRRRAEIDGVLEQLQAQVEDAAGRGANRFMDLDELRSVAGSGTIEIGGHGVSHEQLSSLDPGAQRSEIVDGRRQLQQLAGVTVEDFAYPFGGRDAFDGVAESLVAEAGYRYACAGWGGLTRPWTRSRRIPRFVVGDWEADELTYRLDRWFRR